MPIDPALADPAAPALPLHLIAPADLADWSARQPEAVAAWVSATGFAAGAGELRLLPGPRGGILGAVFGLGEPRTRARQRFLIARAAAGLPEGNWRLEGRLDPAETAEAVLGWLLAGYRFDRYRPGKAGGTGTGIGIGSGTGTITGNGTGNATGTGAPPKAVPRLVPPPGVDAARLLIIAQSEALTRDLINTPANDLGPEELEAEVRAVAADFGAGVAVTTGEDLAQGFPLIAAVGRASHRPPRLIDLRWGGRGPRLTLVGKGVCFDSGGLDIKPAAGMLLMKKDMGGAAITLGLARAIMALDLPLRLRLLIPAVENAVGGAAFRPKDILRSRKGLTVEVNNTDAEGRLILADALTLAAEEAPDLLISMATLTGAARVALGPDLAPFFTDDEALAEALARSGRKVRDPVWRLPFWDGYEEMIEPGIADLDNAPSGGFAGAITAALFLRRFAGETRYAHFDIYGWQPAAAPARPKGGAGQGARAILDALPEALSL